MPNVNYILCVRDSAAGGKPATGLTPSWIFLRNVITGKDVPPPPVRELGFGQYAIAYDPSSGDVTGQLDMGSALSSQYDRYADVLFFVSDSYLCFNLDTKVSSRLGKTVTLQLA